MDKKTLIQLHEDVLTLLGETKKIFFDNNLGAYQYLDMKGLNQLVTDTDISVEKYLVENLKKHTPNASFLTEEKTTDRNKNELEWIIDPVDGTTNYVHRIPIFSISLALQFRGKTIAGYVYEINQDELFSAFRDGKAELNGKPISVREDIHISDSLVATGFPYYDFKGIDNYLQILKYAMHHTRGVRRLGSAAVDLAYVACGRFDVFFEYGLSPWDVAGGAYIVEKAGGKVSTFSGEGDPIFDKEILAGTMPVYDDFLTQVQGFQLAEQ